MAGGGPLLLQEQRLVGLARRLERAPQRLRLLAVERGRASIVTLAAVLPARGADLDARAHRPLALGDDQLAHRIGEVLFRRDLERTAAPELAQVDLLLERHAPRRRDLRQDLLLELHQALLAGSQRGRRPHDAWRNAT